MPPLAFAQLMINLEDEPSWSISYILFWGQLCGTWFTEMIYALLHVLQQTVLWWVFLRCLDKLISSGWRVNRSQTRGFS